MKINLTRLIMYLSSFLILFGIRASWHYYIIYGIFGAIILFTMSNHGKGKQ